jgi:hypothetical protein
VFDRAASNWHPVAEMPDGNLLGADGDGLVFSVMGQEHIALGAGKVINTSGLPISGRMLLWGSSNR